MIEFLKNHVFFYIGYLIGVSLVSFFVYVIDKEKAKRGAWRIPEKVLLTLSFIGGAAGVFGGRLYFLGDPKTHPSYEKISAAAEAASLTVVPLCDGPLRDLGGILFAEGDV